MVVRNEYFDKLETMSPDERTAYQVRKLGQTVKQAYRNAPAVKALFDKSGIKPGQIHSAKDLEKLPVTRKTDLIEMQKGQLPFGGVLAISPEEVARVFISPGPIYECQPAKVKWFARSFWAAGFRKGDIVVNTFTYHMSPAGILFHEGLRDCGATVVVMGTGNTDILIAAMRDLKVTGFVGTPSFLMTVIKRIEELKLNLNRDFALKKAWFTGEMLAPSTRKVLEAQYHLDTYQAYAVTEPGGAIAYECRHKSGLHLMDDYVVEIVDPETGRQLGPGETGEIVVTPVHNKMWGLVRFGTGDLSSYTTEPCPCGRTSYRLTGIIGRAGDAVKVRGMFVVTKQAEQVIAGFDAISHFQLAVRRAGQRDELVLRAELKNQAINKEKLNAEINAKFQDTCRVKIDKFEFVPTGAIPEGKPKLVDERKWD